VQDGLATKNTGIERYSSVHVNLTYLLVDLLFASLLVRHNFYMCIRSRKKVLVRTFPKTFVGATFLLLIATTMLVACGDNGNAAASTGSSGGTGTQAKQGARRGAMEAGTIDKYDATAKTLTVKKSDGSTVTFTTTNARIVKSQKISSQDLSTALGTSGVRVSVMGQQASDGTYTAQNITISGATAMGNGTPPAGGPKNGTPRAGGPGGGTPPAGMNGTPPANGMRRLMLQNAKLQDNQLTGTDQAGKSITVKLSDTTTIFKETSGTTDDLKTGENVSVTPAFSQNGGGSSSNQEARMIIVGNIAETAQQPAN
jgi:hypothetical protein